MPPSLLFFIDASYCFHPFCFATSNTTAWHLNVKPSDVFFVFRHCAAPTWQLPVNLGGVLCGKTGTAEGDEFMVPCYQSDLTRFFRVFPNPAQAKSEHPHIIHYEKTPSSARHVRFRNQLNAAIIIERYVTSVERPQDTLAS